MDTEEDDQLFTNFTHKDAFLSLLDSLLQADGGDDAQEDKLVTQLGAIVSHKSRISFEPAQQT